MLFDAGQLRQELGIAVVGGLPGHPDVAVHKAHGQIIWPAELDHRHLGIILRPEAFVQEVVKGKGIAVDQQLLEGLLPFLARDVEGRRRRVRLWGRGRGRLGLAGREVVALKQKHQRPGFRPGFFRKGARHSIVVLFPLALPTIQQ